MIRAVIFDMFETLITHYDSPLYFGAQMAADAGVSEDGFQTLWRPTENYRSIGKLTLEATLERIFKELHCYSEGLVQEITAKRIAAKEECFKHLGTLIKKHLNCLAGFYGNEI